ncbi:MAG: hypothetical protein R3B89_21085 [Polyangiaceae bacterium]
MRVTLVASLLALALSGCGEKQPRTTTPGTAELGVASSRPAVEPTTASDSDSPFLQEMKALGPQLASCEQLEEDAECEAWGEWKSLYWRGIEHLPVAQAARIESELCALLDSPNRMLRLAGAVGLGAAGRPMLSAEVATRVVRALEREDDEGVVAALLLTTNWINFKERRDLSARYVAMLKAARTDPERLDVLLQRAGDLVGAGEVLLDVFEEAPQWQRRELLWSAARMDPAEGCPIFERALKEPNPKFHAATINTMSSGTPCPALWDQAIAWITKTKMPTASAATNAVGNLDFTPVGVMERYCRQPLSPDQRARLLKQTKRFSTPPGPAVVRTAALHAVLQCDPRSRPFVEGYTSDADPEVAKFARGLLDATQDH